MSRRSSLRRYSTTIDEELRNTHVQCPRNMPKRYDGRVARALLQTADIGAIDPHAARQLRLRNSRLLSQSLHVGADQPPYVFRHERKTPRCCILMRRIIIHVGRWDEAYRTIRLQWGIAVWRYPVWAVVIVIASLTTGPVGFWLTLIAALVHMSGVLYKDGRRAIRRLFEDPKITVRRILNEDMRSYGLPPPFPEVERWDELTRKEQRRYLETTNPMTGRLY